MKKFRYLSLFILTASLLLISCKGKKTDTTSVVDSTGKVVEEPLYAVCIWDKLSLKDAPTDKAKWQASINLGEKCTYLEDIKEDKTGKKPVTYIKIQLQNKQEGWVQSDYVILKSRPATFIKDADLYSRPDLLTKAGKSFSSMDIVAVKTQQGDFIEVVGKRKNGKWIESGWVKPSNVSYNDIDIAVAKYASKAMTIADKDKRNAAINEIVTNADFKNSVFIDILTNIASDEFVPEDSNKDLPSSKEPEVEGD
jgi:hypothetical protein